MAEEHIVVQAAMPYIAADACCIVAASLACSGIVPFGCRGHLPQIRRPSCNSWPWLVALFSCTWQHCLSEVDL